MQPPLAGISRFSKEWKRALISDDVLLGELLKREPPGVAIFEITGFINGIYRAEQKVALFDSTAGQQLLSVLALRPRVEKLLVEVARSRRQLGWDQREVDIALLRWIRRSSMLSPVLGAGVSQAAGAPGWSELVKALLRRALRAGHEVSRMIPSPCNPPEAPIQITEGGELRITGSGSWTLERQVFRVEHFTPEDESRARSLLARLEGGEVNDSELLMQGAQLCSGIFGQHLFTHLTTLLYHNAPQPSDTHRAIALLGAMQKVPGRGSRPGWECVITYNFDDLMGEAFQEQRVPFARWALTTEGAGGDPDKLAQQGLRHIPIFHLHGYTPRRPFLITDTRFVFSTAQYCAIYRDRKDGLIDLVLNKYLANPVHVALYIGCSFIDREMNGLLRQAAQQYPGRWHYAILKWPENRHGLTPDAGEVEAKSQKYVDFGVQPIWVDDYSEIPKIIASLK